MILVAVVSVVSVAEDDGAGSGNTMVSQDSWIKSKAWVGVTGWYLLTAVTRPSDGVCSSPRGTMRPAFFTPRFPANLPLITYKGPGH